MFPLSREGLEQPSADRRCGGAPTRQAPASPEDAPWPLLAALADKFCARPGSHEGAGMALWREGRWRRKTDVQLKAAQTS